MVEARGRGGVSSKPPRNLLKASKTLHVSSPGITKRSGVCRGGRSRGSSRSKILHPGRDGGNKLSWLCVRSSTLQVYFASSPRQTPLRFVMPGLDTCSVSDARGCCKTPEFGETVGMLPGASVDNQQIEGVAELLNSAKL